MTHPTMRIAAAIIRDGNGKLLLVRKRGTSAFMQPGGKIEIDELPVNALARELHEELGVEIADGTPTYVGCFSAPAANEAGSMVEAELFELTMSGEPAATGEIEEMIWLHPDRIGDVELAPLTRDAVMPRYREASKTPTSRC